MNNDFEFKNLPVEAQDKEICADDFKLVNDDKKIREEKFKTRPTTFFKDSLKRFAKNKSSVVASVILGLLLILSIVEPLIDPYPVMDSKSSSYMRYLEPKLFNANPDNPSGFWDGTKKWSMIPAKTVDSNGNIIENQEDWWPNPDRFNKSAVSNRKFTDLTYTDGADKLGRLGYIQMSFSANFKNPHISYQTTSYTQPLNINEDTIYLTTFDVFNYEKLISYEGEKNGVEFPEGKVSGEVELYFGYDSEDPKKPIDYIKILDASETFNIGSAIPSLKEEKINVTDIIKEANVGRDVFNSGFFEIRLLNNNHNGSHVNKSTLIRAVEFDTTSSGIIGKEIKAPNFTDATENILRKSTDEDNNVMQNYWRCNGTYNIHMSQIVYCSFTYDSYAAVFGDKYILVDLDNIESYYEKGWIDWDIYNKKDPITGKYILDEEKSICEILDPVHCPIVEFDKSKITFSSNGRETYVYAKVCMYKWYGFEKMPKFLMGTDKDGKNMLRYVFEGLRTSLLLGIITFAVCFVFGLIWGSVSGYFGGTVDLVMERFTDILSGVPWIVVMTLIIIKWDATPLTFGIALCLTGWIGTAATTRTQFYRFRGREYVLASRTLGASDARLIAKHILPNAMGTIITSAVLMIPSVIFSEATISYLGLGLNENEGIYSLGIILSKMQNELTSNPYLLIFPSVVIALLMISFNLFGNGLRDAVNPSLKGED